MPVAKPPVESKRSSFIDKITGHHEEQPPAPPPAAPEKHESFVNRISDAIRHEYAPPPPVLAKEEKRKSLYSLPALIVPSLITIVYVGFVETLFGHNEQELPPALPPQEGHHLRNKLSGVFKTEEGKEAELKRREEDIKRREEDIKRREAVLKGQEHHGVLDGLKFHRESELPPPKGEESLLDHLSARLAHKTDEPPPPQGLKARVNAILGGGTQSEANEGGFKFRRYCFDTN